MKIERTVTVTLNSEELAQRVDEFIKAAQAEIDYLSKEYGLIEEVEGRFSAIISLKNRTLREIAIAWFNDFVHDSYTKSSYNNILIFDGEVINYKDIETDFKIPYLGDL